MHRILVKEELSPVTKLFVIDAREVAGKAKAGQFVILRVNEKGERIPLTIADHDREGGTITVVTQEVGKTTKLLGTLGEGDSLASVTGPLGRPTEIDKFGTAVVIGGGAGIACVYPICRSLQLVGNRVVGIIGARTRELLLWEEKLRGVTDELTVCTDDGSYGRKGVVTVPLKELLDSGRQVDRIWAVGPAIMMKFVSLTTQPYGVKTIVSLNSIMVDGTGMCGACRVSVGGKTRFACVDGPEFDGHQVDWDLLLKRQAIYLDLEKQALEMWEREGCKCRERGAQ